MTCFVAGTSIATPQGVVLVENLSVGDQVITRDNGIQEIKWIGATSVDGRYLQAHPHLQPILIQKGALGYGLPEYNLTVSPNKRLVVSNDRVSLRFDEDEVLVSAKHLVNPSEGIQEVQSMGITYIHFVFDQHEVVLANGAWVESFHPADHSLKGRGNAQRNELLEIFPELKQDKQETAYVSGRTSQKKSLMSMFFR